MKNIFTKTFSQLTTSELLEIRGIGESPLTPAQLSGLWAVINYRFENLLPTITYTDKKPFELCKALSCGAEYETLAYAIGGRLWEMGVERVDMTVKQLSS